MSYGHATAACDGDAIPGWFHPVIHHLMLKVSTVQACLIKARIEVSDLSHLIVGGAVWRRHYLLSTLPRGNNG